MNPFWFVLKLSAMALVTAAGAAMVAKKLAPKPSDFFAGAVHLRKGMEELHKGVSTILFGGACSLSEQTRKDRKESSRIPID